MDKKVYDWTKFSLKIPVKAAISDIYDYWIYPHKIETFFLEQANFYAAGILKNSSEAIAIGDTYSWKWYGSDMIAKGEVLAVNGETSIQFTFFGCKVTVEIYEYEGEHLVELTQENIPTDEKSKVDIHLGCTRGWTFYLANLKSILEGGIDLRNSNERLGDVVNT